MTELSQQQHDLAEIQEHIDEYAALQPGETYIADYLKAQAEIAAEEAGVMAKAKYLRDLIDSAEQGQLSDLARRRAGLEYHHKEPVARLVHERIQGKKTRHVKTMWGKAGYRTKPSVKTLNVFDEARLAREHPGFFIAQAPKLDRPMLTKSLRGGTALKGMAWLEETPEQDNFYIDTGKKPELTAPPEPKALPEKEGD